MKLYKIVHGLADFSNVPISARDNHFDLNPHTLSAFTAKTNSFKYSLFPHSVQLWNSLPSDVALASCNSFYNILYCVILDGYIPCISVMYATVCILDM